jgi:hypothetical protein
MKVTEQRVRNAAIVLGAASWQSRLEKFGPQELREQLSRAGRLGGRPRKEDPQSVAK